MMVLKIHKKIDTIHAINISQSKNVSNEVFKLNWQLEQMTGGPEKIDSLADIKKRMKRARKKGKKKKKGITHV